ncbi:aromatase/cyclase [Streptomyces aurantiacus]|uniref:Putative Granaticin polyketide synthase bifunctional cyclase n=1 Tax=Streptomyces aurantiacus JA 4570 TaxID=1286094 RepID=S4A245_9ACTN|nr:aromatase/cyclase [Streptomyces aurantiacus]EPH44820.1 putative Granaticin polyketide synthase bifunctional cyclase [Streptomyces aurantiacus JA 4570]
MPSELRTSEHEIKIAAPAESVYRLLAHAENWPQLFPPNIYVDHVERTGREERIRIWATAGDTVKNWTSRRTLDPDRLRIDFRQEVSTPPVAAMGGTWQVEALPSGETLLRLGHDFRATDDEGLTWLEEVVDRNSRSELDSLKALAESRDGDGDGATDELTCSFEDTVQIKGAAQDVYDFIWEADLWSERLPHVMTVRLDEPVPGLQTLEMDTLSKDGSTHTTKSHRVGLAPHRIAYKQTTLPALITLHTGYWTFTPNDDGVAASSQHTFTVDTGNIAKVLGADATVQDAIAYVRTALSTNSMATLGIAKTYAEGLAGAGRS